MSKSKPSQGQHGNIIPTPGSIRRKLDDAAGKPKPMSDHGVPDDDTLDKLSRSTVYLMLRNASKGIDRLKAEVAAKDAEIAPANFLAALRKMVHASEKLKLTATMHWLDIAAGAAHYEIAGRDAETKSKGKRGAK